MAKNRLVNTRFWEDSYTANLDPIEKLLFLYCLTNASTTICGFYEIQLRKIAMETGIDKEMAQKILSRFSSDGRIFYVDGWIGIKNFIKHQNQNSPKVKKGIAEELRLVPQAIREAVQVTRIQYEEGPGLSKRQSLLVRDRFTCRYCSVSIENDSFEMDHIIPVAKGGRDVYANLALACRVCNQSKGDQTALEFVGKSIEGRPFHAEKALMELTESPALLDRFVSIYPDFSLETKLMTEEYPISTLSHLIQFNSIKSNLILAPKKGAVRAKKEPVSQNPPELVVQVLDSFKEVNLAYGRWYGNKTERGAADRLISAYGLEQVLKVVLILSKTNGMAYMPTITKPSQLEDKWIALETALIRKKSEISSRVKEVLI